MPGENLTQAITTLNILDPGKPVILDALPWPSDPALTLARAAESLAAGVALTFFDADRSTAVDPSPLKVFARELAGPLSYSPYATPKGPGRAWAFVREDLGLRVVVETDPGQPRTDLLFADGQLRNPVVTDLRTGATQPVRRPVPILHAAFR